MSDGKIWAVRGSDRRSFSEAQWKNLPKDKYGWVQEGTGPTLPQAGDGLTVAPVVKTVPAKAPFPELEKPADAGADEIVNTPADVEPVNAGTTPPEPKPEQTEEEKQLATVKNLMEQGIDRNGIKDALAISWQKAQSLIDKVNAAKA